MCMNKKPLAFRHFDSKKLNVLISKHKIMLGILCVLGIFIVALLFLTFEKKKPKTYDEYMAQMNETLAMDEFAANTSAAYQGIEDQIGQEAYDALVLGIPVDESSVYYQTQQNNLAASKNESDYAREMVELHESQIRQIGGIVDLKDLERVDVGKYTDAMARAKLTGRYEEYISNLKQGGGKVLEEARRDAAYE